MPGSPAGTFGGHPQPGGGQAGAPVGSGAGGIKAGHFGENGANGSLASGGAGAYGPYITGGFNGGGGGGASVANSFHLYPGGGGGGGFYGGGGGAGAQAGDGAGVGGGGGGGGSSLVPNGGTLSIDGTRVSRVSISFADTTAPVVGLDQPPAISNGPTTLTGSSSTVFGDGNVTVNVYSGGTVAGALVRSHVAQRNGGTGAYSATVAPNLPDGQYTAQATQVDGAGNSSKSPARTFVVDRTGPTISVTAPTPTKDSTPALTGTAGNGSGDSATVQVEITRNDGSVVQTLSAPRNASTGAFAVTPSPALADGFYRAQARQGDTAGNTGQSALVPFRVDTTAPAAPTLTTPAAGARTADTTPEFAGAAETGAKVMVLVYSGEAASGTPVATLQADVVNSSYSIDAASALADGTYTASAAQTDQAGNTSASATRTFAVDTTAPVLTLTAPTGGSATPVFAGVAGVATGDKSEVTVKVLTASGTLVQTVAATRDGATGAYNVPAAFALANGTYTAQATQEDDLGNKGQSSDVTFTVGAVPTVPAASGGTGGSGVQGAVADRISPLLRKLRLTSRSFRKSTKLRFTLNEAATVTIKITRKGSRKVLGTVRKKAAPGARRVTIKKNRLKAGAYVMTVTATDPAGNVSTAKRVSFRVK
jgi:hypothetical protein